jgi:S-(hydroxymethyl)glutathione dehydrogenase/alcohol dehydrogenase
VGSSVVVLGCGAVGLNAIQGGRLAGCDPIIAVDVSAEKLATAEKFGATVTLDANTDDVAARVKEVTGGRGADHVIEAAGIIGTLQNAFDCTRPGGNVILLGKTAVNAQVGLRWGSMMGERHMVRSSYGGARPRRDFPLLAQLYLDGKLNLDDLITTRISLGEINEGFAEMSENKLIRAVIDMTH